MKFLPLVYASAFCSASARAFAAGGRPATLTPLASNAATATATTATLSVAQQQRTRMIRHMSSDSSTTTEDMIKSEIASNDVTIFSKSYCPFCTKTKNTFAELGVEAKIFELDEMDNGNDIQAKLLEMTGQRTVPNVFVKGEWIGGNDNTQAAKQSGKLQELLGL